MNTLSKEVIKLLDKLYNLRGEDSEVLIKMDKERDEAEETKLRTSKEKETLQEKINNLLNDASSLRVQGEKLSEVLSHINENDFALVTERLGLDFNPKDIKEKLDSKLPDTINSVVSETTKAEEQLYNVEEEMNDAITKVEELAIRRDAALALQEKLNEYFDLALNGNINITRDAITSLLEKFGFDEEEQREAAKILMFPEDALYEYDRDTKGQGGKSISEVIAEAKGFSEEQSVSKPINNIENVKSIMNEYGLDYLDYTSNDLEKIASSFNEKVMRNNIEYAKTVGIEVDMFADHIDLLNDEEFTNKVEKLFGLEKTALDVYLNPNVLTKYNYEDLVNAIEKLSENGLDPKKVPLMAF